MPRERKKLALGKGAAFVKARLKRLPQEGNTWEADFRALPKPLSENQTHYLGLVVVQGEGSVLAEEQVEHTPDVNDLATLLAHAMRRPLTGRGHRPQRVRVRKNPRWPELFPHLQEVGVETVVSSDLDTLRTAYHDHLRRVREARRAGMVKPTVPSQLVTGDCARCMRSASTVPCTLGSAGMRAEKSRIQAKTHSSGSFCVCRVACEA